MWNDIHWTITANSMQCCPSMTAGFSLIQIVKSSPKFISTTLFCEMNISWILELNASFEFITRIHCLQSYQNGDVNIVVLWNQTWMTHHPKPIFSPSLFPFSLIIVPLLLKLRTFLAVNNFQKPWIVSMYTFMSFFYVCIILLFVMSFLHICSYGIPQCSTF